MEVLPMVTEDAEVNAVPWIVIAVPDDPIDVEDGEMSEIVGIPYSRFSLVDPLSVESALLVALTVTDD